MAPSRAQKYVRRGYFFGYYPSKIDKKPREEQPICAICHEDLCKKRVVSLRPCGHRFHRTCLLKYFETRQSERVQLCAYCRGRPLYIQSGRLRIKRVHAFGALGQPSVWNLHNVHGYDEMTSRRQVRGLLYWNEVSIDAVEVDRMKEEREWKARTSHLEDIKEELQKLNGHRKILLQMQECLEIMNPEDFARQQQRTPWNYEVELLAAKEMALRRTTGNSVAPVPAAEPPQDPDVVAEQNDGVNNAVVAAAAVNVDAVEEQPRVEVVDGHAIADPPPPPPPAEAAPMEIDAPVTNSDHARFSLAAIGGFFKNMFRYQK